MSARFHHSQRLGPPPAIAASSQLTRNRIIHGNCIDVMSELPDESIELVLTDPPYLCNYRDRQGRTVANDNNDAWLKPAFEQAFRLLAPNSFCISFYGWNQADTFLTAWRAAGFKPVGHLVFNKDYASSSRYLSYQHECAYLLAKGRPEMPDEALPDVRPWDYTGNRLHPTQKPVSVLTPLIEAFCPTDGIVLDPFCGSGSTLVAAQQCQRDWLGIELEHAYCEIAKNRLGRGI